MKNFLADKVQELQATVVQQQKGFQSKLEAQEKQIAALASGLRKIDVRFELTKPEQQLAFKNHNCRFVLPRELLTGQQAY